MMVRPPGLCKRTRRCSPSLSAVRQQRADEVDTNSNPSDGDDDAPSDVWTEGCNVFFFADVSAKSLKQCMKALGEANAEALRRVHPLRTPTIQLHVNSHGGDVFSGFAMYDLIRQNPIPVETFAVGYVASAATFLLLAGERRYIYENAILLIHQMKTGFWGKFDDLCDEMHNTRQLMVKIRKLYRARTALAKPALKQLLHQELEMDATAAVRHGIVHNFVRRASSETIA